MKTLNSKALGNIHTLNAPYFENQFYPEAVLLRAVIYFKYCLYDQAEEAIADFNDKYGPLTKNLQDIVKKYDDNAEFFAYVQKVRQGKAGRGRPCRADLLHVLVELGVVLVLRDDVLRGSSRSGRYLSLYSAIASRA